MRESALGLTGWALSYIVQNQPQIPSFRSCFVVQIHRPARNENPEMFQAKSKCKSKRDSNSYHNMI